jgi:AAA domain
MGCERRIKDSPIAIFRRGHDDPELANTVKELAIKHYGEVPERYRDNSPRFGMLFRGKGFRKRRVAFMDPNGKTHAVERLGEGQQFVAEGKHPSGDEYKWRLEKHPCKLRPEGLPQLTKEPDDAFFCELVQTLEMLGCIVIPHEGGSTAQPLDAPGMAAPSPQHVQAALKHLKNTYKNFRRRDDFVSVAASIYAAFGPDREQYYPDFEAWACSEDWPENTPENVRAIWDSFAKGVSIGWDCLRGLARAKGFVDDTAQEDFKEPVAPEYMPPPDTLDEYGPAITLPATLTLPSAPTTYEDLRRPIPMREFLYDRHYARRFLSTTIAQGGVGKSKLVIAEALAMVSGKRLLDVPVPKPWRVLYWNLEDPFDELQRQFAAAMKFHGLTEDDIGDRLHFYSGRDFRGLKIATEERGTININKTTVAALRKQIIETSADVAIFDPFVALHRVTENDNNKIDAICKELSDLAEVCNSAIEVVHHSRKFTGSQTEASVDDGRGASAMLAACRSARVLNVMPKEEAERFDIGEDRRSYVRVDNGKANLAPPSDKATWFRLHNFQLGNGDPIRHAGDEVGVVTSWKPPTADADVTPDELKTVFAGIGADKWRADPQAKNWIGRPIATALGIALDIPDGIAKVKALIKFWLKDETLVQFKEKDEQSKLRPFIKLGPKINPRGGQTISAAA